MRAPTVTFLNGLLLVAVVFSGCAGTRPVDMGRASATANEPVLPPGIENVLAAHRAGTPLPLQRLLEVAEDYYGVPSVQRTPPDVTDPVAAVLDLFSAAQRPVPPEALPGIVQLATLPQELATAVAQLAASTADGLRLAQAAYQHGAVDWSVLLGAQRLKVAAVEAALPALRASGDAPPGPVVDVCDVLAIDVGSDAHTYTCDYLLLIDAAGNDRYENNAGGNFMLYTSALAVDAGGNDVYESVQPDHDAATGGGFFGAGTLVDAGGDDLYNMTAGEGAALNGAADSAAAGFLADLGGSDTLRGRAGLHAALNGGAWIGAGVLLMVDGPDLVWADGESSGGANGGGWAAPGLVVGLGGDRSYYARDTGRVEGAAGNGGAWGSGTGYLVDEGGATRYEADYGNESGVNGGTQSGSGHVIDLGGGHDYYRAFAGPRSHLNGASAGGQGLLFDDGGVDFYQEDPLAEPAVDATVDPKGETGRQIDADVTLDSSADARLLARTLAAWPLDARRVWDAVNAARAHPLDLERLNHVPLALAKLDPRPAADATGTDLETLVQAFLGPQRLLSLAERLALASLPVDFQAALGDLLTAFQRADADARGVGPATDASAPTHLLRSRGDLLAALDRARPILTRYAGQSLLPSAIDLCDEFNLDLTSQATTYSCDYRFQFTLGGNSVYENRAGSPWEGGAAVLVDAGGDDLYLGPVPQEGEGVYVAIAGSATNGLGFLADLSGNDLYAPRCPEGCVVMGSGAGGAGTLVDAAGDDRYVVQAAGNASAANGAAILTYGFLADLGGSDVYDASGPMHSSFNGADFLGGHGFLHDREGNDIYRGVAGEHGVVNAGSTSGGAVLWDAAGDDYYWGESGHHGQTNGAAFFASVQTLVLDERGDDTYVGVAPMGLSANGNHYVVGRCPAPRGCGHGVAALMDGSGLDAYVEWLTMPSMTGHDHGHGEEPMEIAAMPDPSYDQTVVPKGDLGAQLDLNVDLG